MADPFNPPLRMRTTKELGDLLRSQRAMGFTIQSDVLTVLHVLIEVVDRLEKLEKEAAQ